MSGHGLRGAVVGWYLSVLVVGGGQMKKRGGVSVVVMVERVAVSRTAGRFEQAGMVQIQDGQEAVGRHHRSEGAGR